MSADTFFQVSRDRLVALASRYAVPVMYEWPEFVRAGGLISYSTVRVEYARQAGIYVRRKASRPAGHSNWRSILRRRERLV
jgi:putative tryptophan/tyrosine transport system substrate-binding protein